ncbi:MAG: sigma-54-dependent transcriptional regulator [Sphingomonadaceae bacterium]
MSHRTDRSLLLIDDEPAQSRLIEAIAARAGWRVTRATDLETAMGVLEGPNARSIDVVLIDQWSPDGSGPDLIRALRASFAQLPVMILTAQDSSAQAVEAMRAGATDFLIKPIAPDRLLVALETLRDANGRKGELRPLSEKIPYSLAFDEIVGSAPEFRAALAIAAKAARARVPVLIEGESGTGKEVIAQAIHAASPRGKRPMFVVNCGAIPTNLVESELFGHEKGAFTGAFDRQIGRFAHAEGSSIFLDEIGELPLEAQVKLLRVLQSGEIQPLGSRHVQHLDVRVIAATNRNLAEDIAEGRFREDLYYRLNVVPVSLPPLRKRTGDIPALARHLLTRISAQPGMRRISISDEAIQLLSTFSWPGNVRQLHNALFRAAILCDGDSLTPADFPHIAVEASRQTAAPRALGPVANIVAGGITLFEANGHLRTLSEIEADVIRLAIGHYRGRMSEVARRLGIGRSTLYRKLAELGISDAA